MSEQQLPQELEDQAAAYVLGALAPEDCSLFVRRLAIDPTRLGRETTRFQAAADQLALAVRRIAPRPSLRERILTHVATESDREAKSFAALAGSLAFGTTPMTPSDSVRERLLHNLDRQRDQPSLDRVLTFVKSGEGQWKQMADGVLVKVLYFDPLSRRATALVRMAPGSSYAPHRHAEAEELYVLEGGCFCGGQELSAGDYHRAEAGTEHHDTSSDDGCLLLVISSPQNEMLG